jgi:hypothetical protein
MNETGKGTKGAAVKTLENKMQSKEEQKEI